MNRNWLKIIAAISMTIDHLGYIVLNYFEPTPAIGFCYTCFRSIGRVAYVLFAFMIVQGFLKTSNLKKYFLRLLGYAVFLEFFILLFAIYTKNFDPLLRLNVIWSFVFGLGALMLLKSSKLGIRLLVIPIVFLAEFLNLSYGAYGVLMILFFAIYQNPLTQLLFLTGLNLLFIEYPLFALINRPDLAKYAGVEVIQWFSLAAFIFIFLSNGKKGKYNMKWFFYIFYPAHLGVIYGVFYLLNR